ncbi:MAG: FecR domain-containing protein [Treponema sp.]|nr:FecR domain-containing protein [Treponema sp.]
MKKIFCLLITLFLAASVFAAEATVTYVSGKVEVQRGDKWVPLQKGDTLAKSDMVSTGFQSEAKIKLYESVLYLGPVTRVSLEELSSSGNQDNVSVYLKTGSARSQVKHVDEKRVKYQVHTAIAVASCRGTDWILDDSNKVVGIDGEVAVDSYTGAEDAGGIILTANQTLKVSEDGTVSEAKSNVDENAAKVLSTVATEAQKKSGTSDANDTNNFGSGTIVKVHTGTVIVGFELDENLQL